MKNKKLSIDDLNQVAGGAGYSGNSDDPNYTGLSDLFKEEPQDTPYSG